MKYQVHQTVVIGAGTMGAAIAAHLANAGLPVTLLDIVPADAPAGDQEARNRIVNAGLERAKQSRPPSFVSPGQAALVRTGNLEDDFDAAVGRADWVIEAIVESLVPKQALMARIDARRRPHCIVSSNTSGLPLKEIAAGRSQDFKKHFLGTHFFNPPRYLKLLEVIPIGETLPGVLKSICHVGESRLGKGIVVCRDTPNFIGNRLAFGTGAFGLHYILGNGYRVEEVDALSGPLIGHPRTAIFRLIDLVGLDVWAHVCRNLAGSIPYDTYIVPYLKDEKVNNLVRVMLAKGWLGNKAGAGFYREVNTQAGRQHWPLNLQTLEHQPPQKPFFESIEMVKDIEKLGERLKALMEASDRGAALVKALALQGFQYASAILPEVADTPNPVDDAARWGFGHEAGPFELWDMLGVRPTVARMKADGYTPAPWVEEMLKAGFESFYEYNGETKVNVYDVSQQKYMPLARP